MQQAPEVADADRRDHVRLLDPQRNLARREVTEGQCQLGRLRPGDRRDQGRLDEHELWRLPRTRPVPEASDDRLALPLIFSEALVPEDHCAATQPQPDADFVDRDRVGGPQNDPGSVC